MATKARKKAAKREHPYQIGKLYLIRTVTNYAIGRLTWVGPQELVLEDAAWVASTGRFEAALRTGELEEVEPWPDGEVVIGRGSIVDACLWPHAPARLVR